MFAKDGDDTDVATSGAADPDADADAVVKKSNADVATAAIVDDEVARASCGGSSPHDDMAQEVRGTAHVTASPPAHDSDDDNNGAAVPGEENVPPPRPPAPSRTTAPPSLSTTCDAGPERPTGMDRVSPPSS